MERRNSSPAEPLSPERQLEIGVVGLGLIGGSLAKSIKKKRPACKIYALSRSEAPLKQAVADGVLEKYAVSDGYAVFSGCDAVFICTPVDTVGGHIEKLLPHIKPTCILTDAGSTKASVCAAAKQMGARSFIGGHPMAGSEKTGYGAASDFLFENAFYILTPEPGADAAQVEFLKQLVSDIGALPIVMEPEEHDCAVAAVSHVPHVAAAALVNLVKRLDGERKYMYHLAAGGFKDITRVASSSPEMWAAISMENRGLVLSVLRGLGDELKFFADALEAGRKNELYAYFDRAGAYRETFANNRSAFAKVYELRADIEDKPGSIATVATLLSVNKINIKNIGIINSREYENGVLQIAFDTEDEKLRSAELMRKLNFKVYTE